MDDNPPDPIPPSDPQLLPEKQVSHRSLEGRAEEQDVPLGEEEEGMGPSKKQEKGAITKDEPFDLSKIKLLDTNYVEKLGEEEASTKKKKKKKLSRKERLAIKKQKMIDDTKIIMRDHLTRELELTKKTALKFTNDWEDLISAIKLEEMKQDLVEWSNKVNRLVEMKDQMVKNMISDMDHTMELANKSHAQFVQVLNFYHGIHKACIQIIKDCYDSQAHDMLYSFQIDLKNQNDYMGVQKLHFEQKMHSFSMKEEQTLLKDKEVFDIKKDEIMNENIVQRYELRDKIAKQMKLLQKNLCDFVDSLKNTIESDKYEKYEELMKKHRAFQEEQERLDKIEMAKMLEYQQCQQNLLKAELVMNKRWNNLQQEFVYFAKVRDKRLSEIDESNRYTHEQIKAITVGSHELLEKYKKIKRTGELILALAIRCRKMQTQDEKIHFEMRDKKYWDGPVAKMREYKEFWDAINEKCKNVEMGEDHTFYPLAKPEIYDLDLVNNIFKIRTLELKCHLDLTDAELKKHLDLFENFWRRQALVEAEVIVLRKEKAVLAQEHERYTDYIKTLGFTSDPSKLRECISVETIIPTPETVCNKTPSETPVTVSFLSFPSEGWQG